MMQGTQVSLTSQDSKKYTAFISYRHKDTDRAHATALEKQLKTYALRPWVPPRKIFRDETHMVPNVDLSRAIKEALNRSEYLLLLASPESAASSWVRDEIVYWCRELGRTEKLIIIHIAGTIATQDTTPDIESSQSSTKVIDWDQTNALDPAIRELFPQIPFYIDLTWATTDNHRILDNFKYKQTVNRLVAKFHNIDPNDMLGEEVRAHRAQILIRNSFIAGLTMLAIAAIIAGSFAYLNWREVQKKQAQSYIQQAKTMVAQGVSQAASIYGAASQEMDDNLPEGRLFAAELHNLPKLLVEQTGNIGALKKIRFIGPTDYFVAQPQTGELQLYQYNRQQKLISALPWPETVGRKLFADVFDLNESGRKILLAKVNHQENQIEFECYTIETDKDPIITEDFSLRIELPQDIDQHQPLAGVSIDNSGIQIVASTGDTLYLIDAASQKRQAFTQQRNQNAFFYITSLAMNWHNRTLALGNPGGELLTIAIPMAVSSWDFLTPFKTQRQMRIFTDTGMEASPGIEDMVWANTKESTLYGSSGIYNRIFAYNEFYASIDLLDLRADMQIHDLALSSDNTYLIAAGEFFHGDWADRDTNIGLLSFFHGNNIYQVLKRITLPHRIFTAVALSNDNEILVTSTDKGEIHIWKLSNHGGKILEMAGDYPVETTVGKIGEGYLFTWGEDNQLTLFAPAGPSKITPPDLRDILHIHPSPQHNVFYVIRSNDQAGFNIEQLESSAFAVKILWKTGPEAVAGFQEKKPILTMTDDSRTVAFTISPTTIRVVKDSGAYHDLELPPENKLSEEVRWLAFKPKSHELLVGTSQRIFLIETNRATKKASQNIWTLLFLGTEYSNHPRFSSSGRYLVIEESDLLRIFDLVLHTEKSLHFPQIDLVQISDDEQYLSVLSSSWETALGIYSLPNLDTRIERIDLGLPKGTPVYFRQEYNKSVLVGITTDNRKKIQLYDIKNIYQALSRPVEEPETLRKTYENRYNFYLEEAANIVRDPQGASIPAYF